MIRNWTGYSVKPRPDFFLDLWETPVRVSDHVLSCTVFLGRDDRGEFVAYGTGFISAVTKDGYMFQQLVTARHVVEDIEFDPICVRLNDPDGRLKHAYVDKDAWVFHPDESIDVAVCASIIPPERYGIRHVNVEEDVPAKDIFEEYDLGIGDEVYMAGMYTRHLGSTTNTPILRIGNLAAIPKEKVETNRGFVHAYLIEARSIAGLSGSPVYLHRAPFRILPDGQIKAAEGGKAHVFLGMMQGHHVTSNPSDIATPDDDYTPTDMNSGIGVVILAEQIMEVIMLPELEEVRKGAAKKAREASGFVADSAGPKPSTTDENPQHKEDFNRLLGAASKGKQSDG